MKKGWKIRNLTWILLCRDLYLEYIKPTDDEWSIVNKLKIGSRTKTSFTFNDVSLRSFAMITNNNFRIPISLQPDFVDFWYLKLWVLLGAIVEVWNIKGKRLPLQRYGIRKTGFVIMAQLLGQIIDWKYFIQVMHLSI